jgi:aryl-alcohol dehydrogenase-like predicted oxidoreductase
MFVPGRLQTQAAGYSLNACRFSIERFPPMQTRKLGRTGIDVSLICLGTMTWGQQNTEAEGHEQMDYAVSRGVNFFDTAELYAIPPKPETQGRTEEIIGTWFAARRNRDKIILATKVAGRSTMSWLREDKSQTRLTRAQMTEALEKSLKRLKTGYIDLYQMHFPERPMPWGSLPTSFNAASFQPAADESTFEEQLDVLGGFIREGKVRYIGASNESPWGLMKFIAASERHGLPRIQSVQNAYSLVNRTFETGTAEVCVREEISLLAYSPLAQGYLTGKYRHGALPAGARKTLFNRLQRYEKPEADAAYEAYFALAAELGMTPATLALAFVNSRSFMGSNIIGATSMAQLSECLDAANVTLSDEAQSRIEQIHLRHMNPCP